MECPFLLCLWKQVRNNLHQLSTPLKHRDPLLAKVKIHFVKVQIVLWQNMQKYLLEGLLQERQQYPLKLKILNVYDTSLSTRQSC